MLFELFLLDCCAPGESFVDPKSMAMPGATLTCKNWRLFNLFILVTLFLLLAWCPCACLFIKDVLIFLIAYGASCSGRHLTNFFLQPMPMLFFSKVPAMIHIHCRFHQLPFCQGHCLSPIWQCCFPAIFKKLTKLSNSQLLLLFPCKIYKLIRI